MNNLDKKAKAYFIISMLGFFVLISLFFFNPDLVNPRNYLLLCLTFFLAIFAFSTQLVAALFASLFLVFTLGSLILYQAVFHGALELTFARDYFWLLVFPVTAYLFGRLGDLTAAFSTTITDLEQKVATLVRVDDLTGFSNKKKFYEDLYDEMRRAKRHKFDLVAMMVKIMYFEELVSMYGQDKTDDVLRLMVDNIQQVLRSEDKKYRLEPDTFAFVLPNTNSEGAEMVKSRLNRNLDHITLTTGNQQEKLNFNFKIGILQYDRISEDVFEFRQQLEQELEYDV
jgi:diguanylate cyclase (GGDEF)-like protein